jgi:hypothetical protein
VCLGQEYLLDSVADEIVKTGWPTATGRDGVDTSDQSSAERRELGGPQLASKVVAGKGGRGAWEERDVHVASPTGRSLKRSLYDAFPPHGLPLHEANRQ